MSIVQSIQARTPSRIGEPSGLVFQPMPANLSSLLPCEVATQPFLVLGEDVHAERARLLRCAASSTTCSTGQNATSGGSSDTDVNEPDREPDRLVVGCCGHDRHSGGEVTEHLTEDGGIDVGRFSQRRRSTPPRR